VRCRKITSYLNAYADGELPVRLRRVVESHLAACESCRRRLEEILGTAELFEGTLPAPPVPDGLAARIMAEAHRRQPAGIPGGHSPSPTWNPFQWVAGLSTSMKIAACATVLLAIGAGLALGGANVTRGNVLIEQGIDLHGVEWFAPVPPGSISSIYIAMTDQPYERGDRQ